MRNKLLAIAAIAGAMSAPIAAKAQSEMAQSEMAQSEVTTGVARDAPVVVTGGVDAIAADQRPAFREYIIEERVPNHAIPDQVVVGGILPEVGVTYYDVPQRFGVTPYRYTVVNGEAVLVEPRTRRIVEVVD
jgi:hypothetical protein